MAKRRRKKKKLKIKNIMILLLILIIIGLASYYIITLPINNIYIKGNEIVSETEILSLAKIEEYPSFLLTSEKDIIKKLKLNHYIKEVKIYKKLGNKLYINIKEYTPICLINNDKILLSNGEILENTYNITDIPHLKKEIEDKELMTSFTEKFEKIEKNILRQVSEIEYKPVNVDKERFLLYMDDGNQVYITLTKIEKINKYDEIKNKMGEAKGIIYLDSGDYVELKNQKTETSEENETTEQNEDSNTEEQQDRNE